MFHVPNISHKNIHLENLFYSIRNRNLLFIISGSVYSVVVVATERYFNICKPFHKNLVSRIGKYNVIQHGVLGGYMPHF